MCRRPQADREGCRHRPTRWAMKRST
jgi:hypothetical protein